MLILMSPSKTMDYSDLSPIELKTKGLESQKIRALLSNLSPEALKLLYKSSDQVVKQAMALNTHSQAYKAIELFNGAVFKNLLYPQLPLEAQGYIHKHVAIMSAMYGIVAADEAICPYRLDLNNPLQVGQEKLTQYWKPYVNHFLKNETSLIVDLASNEYRKLIDKKAHQADYICVDFKELRQGTYKTVGTYAKMARGQFIAAMAMNQVTSKEQLKEVCVMDYHYEADLSSHNHYLYTR